MPSDMPLFSCTQHNDWRPHLTAPKSPVLQTMLRARPTKAKTTAELEQEELEKAPKFKAKPLNKKVLVKWWRLITIYRLHLSLYRSNLESHKPIQIFESKGEMGIFCNTKKHITIPHEFHFATDERISRPSSVLDIFDKVCYLTNIIHTMLCKSSLAMLHWISSCLTQLFLPSSHWTPNVAMRSLYQGTLLQTPSI